MDSALSPASLEQQFDETFDCYVINLARTPERMAAFYGRNGASGIRFRRFEAADGNAIHPDEAVRQGIIKPLTKWSSKGTIGVALSHRNLWDKAVAENRPLVIFEDDAYIRADLRAEFMRAMVGRSGWDIVLLGYNTDSLLEFNLIADLDASTLFTPRYMTAEQLNRFHAARGPVTSFPLRHAFGICGYAIQPSGAKHLREKCFPMDNRMLEFPATERRFPAFSIDSMMNAFYREIGSFACIPPLVLAENDWNKSTIAKPRVSPGSRKG